jgi:solute carrier family 26 (sodium-independent sulfate anion transporter), member 11
VQFHFATILSPWIRRALIAGGFGVGQPASRAPQEIAAVVPYRDGLREREIRVEAPENDDIEKSISSKHVEGDSSDGVLPLPFETPFFHIDLQAAVRAAESGLP